MICNVIVLHPTASEMWRLTLLSEATVQHIYEFRPQGENVGSQSDDSGVLYSQIKSIHTHSADTTLTKNNLWATVKFPDIDEGEGTFFPKFRLNDNKIPGIYLYQTCITKKYNWQSRSRLGITVPCCSWFSWAGLKHKHYSGLDLALAMACSIDRPHHGLWATIHYSAILLFFHILLHCYKSLLWVIN